MPVIVASEEAHPFLPSLASGAAIDQGRALHQDIRPLQIAILNLMADKMTTERQLAAWLGSTPLQVNLTFVATDGYVRAVRNGHKSRTTPAEHIVKFYNPLSDIRADKFDGLIVTGVNALQPRVSDEAFWPEVQEILDWSASHVFSSLYLCWGAKAALKHFHDVESIKGERKTSGLFHHRVLEDRTGLLFGFPDEFSAPVSRWKNPDKQAIAKRPALEVVAVSEETGPNIMVEFGAVRRGGSPLPAPRLCPQPPRIRDRLAAQRIPARPRGRSRDAAAVALLPRRRSDESAGQSLAPHRAALRQLGEAGLRGDAVRPRADPERLSAVTSARGAQLRS